MSELNAITFYKRGTKGTNHEVKYMIPWNSSTTGATSGSYKITKNQITQMRTVVNDSVGSPAEPLGVNINKILDSFYGNEDYKVAKSDGYYRYYLLDGLDGGSMLPLELKNSGYTNALKTPYVFIEDGLEGSGSNLNRVNINFVFLGGNLSILLTSDNGVRISQTKSGCKISDPYPPSPAVYDAPITMSYTTFYNFPDVSFEHTINNMVGKKSTSSTPYYTIPSGVTVQEKFSVDQYVNCDGGSIRYVAPNDYTRLYTRYNYTFTLQDASDILHGVTYDIDTWPDVDSGTHDDSDADGTGTGPDSLPSGDTVDDESDVTYKNIFASGMLHGYVLNDTQLSAFRTWLWTDNIMDYISKLFTSNPFDSIVTFGVAPYPITTISGATILLGSQACDTVTDAQFITSQVSTVKIVTSTDSVYQIWGNSYDYDKGLKIEMFVPFVGVIPLDTNMCIDATVTLVYKFDIPTGQGVVTIYAKHHDTFWDTESGTNMVGTYAFNCLVSIPLSRNEVSNVISGAMQTGASLLAGNVAGSVSGAMSARPSIQQSGPMTTASTYLQNRKGWFKYTISKLDIPSTQYVKRGRPQYTSKLLSDCSGFTKCDSPQLDIDNATSTENDMIQQLLTKGVII